VGLAFNHDEAIRCFERALELDPDLADRPLGHRVLDRPELQQGVGGVRPVDMRRRWPRPNGTRLAVKGRASASNAG
jgi:hypothetical protein